MQAHRSAFAQSGLRLGAAWLATHIGLANTVMFTHIPSILLLAPLAFAPRFGRPYCFVYCSNPSRI